MHGLENEDKQLSNLALNDGEEVGDGGECGRGGRPLTKALGDRAHHRLQPVGVRLLFCGGFKYSSGIADDASSSRGEMNRSMDS